MRSDAKPNEELLRRKDKATGAFGNEKKSDLAIMIKLSDHSRFVG